MHPFSESGRLERTPHPVGFRQATDRTTVELTEILISSGHDYWVRKGRPRHQHGMRSIDRATLVAQRGIMGDRYFDKRAGHRGQVTLIDGYAIQELAAEFPGFGKVGGWSAATLRRNLVVHGIELASLLGVRFTLGGVQFLGSQECRPCRWMDQMIGEGAKAFLTDKFRGGLRATIEIGGELVIGPQPCLVSEPGRGGVLPAES